ncbi:MAG: anti-anti-sigma factor [Rhodospirillales bacterium RIFCSPLOWO2_12_FULL_58_28]|nr:MAG: anti-anti-sigma factor [Rhodospirillales bacterium RIFCSPLOWO2_02_FULL_58_16]OHC76802.1 MAG: anti-anti-sigma factor [Rhodospirillales bacterium RIFCSPLOWO2_12_FULL_58_28]
MKHEIREENNTTIVCLKGDVDLESSPAARKILMECVKKGHPILVDLSEVGYIDSSGVASLVEALQSTRKKGLDFALAHVSEGALRVLHLARLDKIFTIHKTIKDGLAANS